MGICYLQHRIVVGLYNNKNAKINSPLLQRMRAKICQWGNRVSFSGDHVRCVLYTFTTILYMYIICMLLAVAAKLLKTDISVMHKNVNFIQMNTRCVNFEIRTLVNTWVLIIISMLMKVNYPNILLYLL